MCWCLILEWVDGKTFNVNFSIIRDKFTTVLCFLYEELKNTKGENVLHKMSYTQSNMYTHTHMYNAFWLLPHPPVYSSCSYQLPWLRMLQIYLLFMSLCFICKPPSLTKGSQHIHGCGHVHWRLKPLQRVNNWKQFSLLQHPIASSSPGRGTYHELFLSIVYDWLLVDSIV